MICKIVFGNDFHGCLDYITGKYDPDKHTKILGHSDGIPDMDNRTIAQIFKAYSEKGGHDINNPVGHFAYSFHRNDASRITDGFMMKIIQEHMKLLGIRDTEWIVGRHYDTDHEHAHLMFSMVDRHGKVIDDSMIYARNRRICKYLTKKYGLTMSSDKSTVNRDKLRGKEKLKYEFYDKVMKCRQQSSSWDQFDRALSVAGLKLCFHYNNVNGRLMGVAFTDGRHSFSGRQLDPELKLDSLMKEYGDLRQLVFRGIRRIYLAEEQRQSRNEGSETSRQTRHFDDVFPDFNKVNLRYQSAPSLLSRFNEEECKYRLYDYTPSEDGKTGFLSLNLLLDLLVQPYDQEMSMGGGGSCNSLSRKKDDDDEEKERIQNAMSKPVKSRPAYRPRRR